ncbi:MAG: YbaB/EbfC family nucleoid-associated protein [Magnetococcales bacterium]|nr:YbaB/EbfC family nucleoid-associated protein [Magnetococcales bacterium]
MKNLGDILKQAQKMQGEMAKIQEEMAATSIIGQSGGGMVEVTMDGKQEVKSVRLDPTVVDARDVEMLEDLIASAFNDAQKKVQAMTQENMAKMTGGLNIPGMKLPF